jgi:hypothetical protein
MRADQVTVSLAGAGVSPFTRTLTVLPGDFDDNGVVNRRDLRGIRAEINGTGGAKPTIFGDINGDGVVDINDLRAVRHRLGARLPKSWFPGMARPEFRTEARRLVSRGHVHLGRTSK